MTLAQIDPFQVSGILAPDALGAEQGTFLLIVTEDPRIGASVGRDARLRTLEVLREGPAFHRLTLEARAAARDMLVAGSDQVTVIGPAMLQVRINGEMLTKLAEPEMIPEPAPTSPNSSTTPKKKPAPKPKPKPKPAPKPAPKKKKSR